MHTLKKLLSLAVVALCVAVAIPVATAAPGDPNPSKFCREILPVVDPEASEFLGTGGGCVSSVASVGIEALMNGAFPSTAAAIANCKGLEATAFMATSTTGKPYPYAFYGNTEWTANNRADCVWFLRAFHTGILEPPPDPEA